MTKSVFLLEADLINMCYIHGNSDASHSNLTSITRNKLAGMFSGKREGWGNSRTLQGMSSYIFQTSLSQFKVNLHILALLYSPFIESNASILE